MAMHHMSDKIFEFTSELPGGGIGIVVAAICAWPQQTQAYSLNGPSPIIWHNAFTHSLDFGKVVDAGIVGGAFTALAVGLFATAVIGGTKAIISWRKAKTETRQAATKR
jgi:hypothetical protein